MQFCRVHFIFFILLLLSLAAQGSDSNSKSCVRLLMKSGAVIPFETKIAVAYESILRGPVGQFIDGAQLRRLLEEGQSDLKKFFKIDDGGHFELSPVRDAFNKLGVLSDRSQDKQTLKSVLSAVLRSLLRREKNQKIIIDQRLRPVPLREDIVRGSAQAAVLSQDRRYVFIPSSGAVWDLIANKRIWDLGDGGQTHRQFAFSPDAKFAVLTPEHGEARIYNAQNGHFLHVLADLKNDLPGLEFSPDGSLILCVAGVWHVQTGHKLRGFPKSVRSVRFLDNQRIVSISDRATLDIWTISEEGPTGSFVKENPFQLPIDRVLVSPDQSLAVTSSNREIKRPQTPLVWNAKTGVLYLELDSEDTSEIKSFAFSFDSKFLVTQTQSAVNVWNLSKRSYVTLPTISTDVLAAASIFPDGKYVALGTEDGKLQIWDMTSLSSVAEYKNAFRWLSSLSFSSDGRFLIMIGDNKVTSWHFEQMLDGKRP